MIKKQRKCQKKKHGAYIDQPPWLTILAQQNLVTTTAKRRPQKMNFGFMKQK